MGERILRELRLEIARPVPELRLFYSIKEIRVLAERWSVHYDAIRLHSSLGYRPPTPEAWAANIQVVGKREPLR